MKTEWQVNPQLMRVSIALVWLYQGFWCKVLGGSAHHLAVISAVPLIGPATGRFALLFLGLIECGLAVWVMTGRQLRCARWPL
ncbi:MAG: DoxX-like family protein [Terracidiphilus sp.]